MLDENIIVPEQKVYRVDTFKLNLTKNKEKQIAEIINNYRSAVKYIIDIQLNLFRTEGRFNKRPILDHRGHAVLIGSVARVGMVHAEVVKFLKAWIGNLSNDFRTKINEDKSLSQSMKHMFHIVNKEYKWFWPNEISYYPNDRNKPGIIIPDDVRKLIKKMFNEHMSEYNIPDLSNINVWLDSREIIFEDTMLATQNDNVPYWIHFRTPSLNRKFYIPVHRHQYFENRKGMLANGALFTLSKNKKLSLALATDISESIKESKQNYVGTGIIAIDFGFKHLGGTNLGTFIGPKDWNERLKEYDRQIKDVGSMMRRKQLLPTSNRHYQNLIQDMRGYIKTEIRTAIKSLIKNHTPHTIVIENLSFNKNKAGRWKDFNRQIRNCGLSEFKRSLMNMSEKYGIKIVEINPAYTSQTCSCCHYLDRRNRNRNRKDEMFSCLWCGYEEHADINATHNILDWHISGLGNVYFPQEFIRYSLINYFEEDIMTRSGYPTQRPGGGPSSDPRLTNDHYNEMGVMPW